MKSGAPLICVRIATPPWRDRDASDDELVDCDGRDQAAVGERAFDHRRELGVRVGDWLTLGGSKDSQSTTSEESRFTVICYWHDVGDRGRRRRALHHRMRL